MLLRTYIQNDLASLSLAYIVKNIGYVPLLPLSSYVALLTHTYSVKSFSEFICVSLCKLFRKGMGRTTYVYAFLTVGN